MSVTSNTSDQLFLLDNREDLTEHVETMLSKADRSVYIFSRKLNPLFFNHSHIADKLSALARKSHRSDIKILIESPQYIVEENHRILHLSHRLMSKIKLQKIVVEPQDDYEFMIVDNDKLWLQHKEESYTGFANYDARPEVKRFNIVFNDLWKNSEEDVRLRRLSL